MTKKQTKPKRGPTNKQRIFIAEMLANGGKMTAAAAARRAGYKESMARNTQKLTSTPIYAEYLERAGLNDQALSLLHANLTRSSHIVVLDIHYAQIESFKGKRKKSHFDYQKLDHDSLRKVITRIPGAEVLVIVDNDLKKCHTIYYSVPNDQGRKAGLELALKAKDLLAPDKFDISLKHEVTEEEKAEVEDILKNNR